jgi:hypothetical protein
VSSYEEPDEPQDRIIANQEIPAARALEVVKDLTADPEGREAFTKDPARAFDERRRGLKEPALREANYGDIPENSRKALEALSIEQLEGLSKLDATFVEDGLYVEVPSPGRLMIH